MMSLDASTIALEEVQRQTQEAPTQELLRRFADQSPTWLMPRLYAIQHFGQMEEDARQRLMDDHIIHLRATGAHDLADKWLEAKPDMGAISVTGDTYNILPPAPPAAPAAAAPPANGTLPTTPLAATPATVPTATAPAAEPAKSNGKGSLLWPAVVGACLLGTGAGALSLYNWATEKPSTVINQPVDKQDWKLGIQVKHGPPQ